MKLIPQNKTQNIYEYFKDNMNEEEWSLILEKWEEIEEERIFFSLFLSSSQHISAEYSLSI